MLVFEFIWSIYLFIHQFLNLNSEKLREQIVDFYSKNTNFYFKMAIFVQIEG